MNNTDPQKKVWALVWAQTKKEATYLALLAFFFLAWASQLTGVWQWLALILGANYGANAAVGYILRMEEWLKK